MAEKTASSSSGGQFLLVILLIVGILVLTSGRLGKGTHTGADSGAAVVDPAVEKYIGKLKRQDRLDDRDREELQSLVDKLGK